MRSATRGTLPPAFPTFRTRAVSLKRAASFLLRHFAICVTLVYAAGAGLWVLLSDRWLALFSSDANQLSRLHTYKGLAFVALTALLLFLVLEFLSSRLSGKHPHYPAGIAVRRLGLRTQLVTLVFAVAIPLLAVLGYALYRQADSDAKRASNLALSLAQIAAADASDFVLNTQHLLAQLARRDYIRSGDLARCAPALQDVSLMSPHATFANLLVTDEQGQIVCSTLRETGVGLRSVAQAEWFYLVRGATRLAMGKPLHGPLTGRWVLPVAYPLRDADGAFRGALHAAIDLKRMQPIANNVKLPQGTIMRITGSDGTVIAQWPDSDDWVGKNTRGVEITEIMLARKHGIARTVGLDGIERIYGYTPVSGTDWFAVSGVPTAVVFADVRIQALESALLGSAILVLVALLAYALSRNIERPITAIARVAVEVAAGNTETRAPIAGSLQTASVAREFNRMLDVRAELEKERQRYIDQLRGLAARLVEVEEEQHRDLARELHDRVGQNLSALMMSLDIVKGRLPADGVAELRERIDDCRVMLEDTMTHVREVLADLRPPLLDDFGLLSALRDYAQRYTKRHGIPVLVSGNDLQRRLGHAEETALFRVAQEALSNTAKHAQASEIRINLSDAGFMEIEDNGIGFAIGNPQARPTWGLIGMRERMQSIGGTLQVDSRPGGGTRVVARIRREQEQCA